VDLYVKNLMAVGKLFIILLSSIALVGCGAHNPHNTKSSYASVASDYQNANSSIVVGLNYFKWSTHRMNKYDRKQQEQAVFFALNNLQNGEETNWYNGNTGAKGRVRIAMTYPQGSGYCRVIQSEITYKGKKRNITETACINAVDNSWSFLP
jgi:surface antigen